jgi:hypothetical protein
LFVVLTLAVSVPLWFYSEKIIFNARYLAARSEVLQDWLRESDLELKEVDILRERQILYLSLEGPEPPVNIGELHERLKKVKPVDELTGFKIEYTWTQKVTGTWPQEGRSIEEFAELAEASMVELVVNPWAWQLTQYSSDSSAHPGSGDNYVLSFKENGKFEVIASCGNWTGKFSFGGKSLSVTMDRNWFSGCRDDEALKVFLEDLNRARAAYLEGGRLKITLANGEGIMYFKRG